MKSSLVVQMILATILAGSAAADSPAQPFQSDAEPAPQSRIDELVLGRLRQLGIAPAKLCSDGVFVRRVYLDVTGTLPTAGAAKHFLNDREPRAIAHAVALSFE